MGRALLLSLKPRHAESILDGSKTVEVRRRTVLATPRRVEVVALYATAPVQAIVGTVRLRRTEQRDPCQVWAAYGPRLGVTEDELGAYLDGVGRACLLHLMAPRRADQTVPLMLEQLRRHGGFRPAATTIGVAAMFLAADAATLLGEVDRLRMALDDERAAHAKTCALRGDQL